MNAEAIIAKALEGKFFLVDGTDRNCRREQEAFNKVARERQRMEQLAARRAAREAQRIIASQRTMMGNVYPITAIVLAVATAHNVSVDEITSTSRFRHVVAARVHACALIYELRKASFCEIGRHVGRDHSTVIYSLEKWKEIGPLHAKADRIARELLA